MDGSAWNTSDLGSFSPRSLTATMFLEFSKLVVLLVTQTSMRVMETSEVMMGNLARALL